MISSTPPQQCLDNGLPRGYGSCKKHFERPPDYREYNRLIFELPKFVRSIVFILLFFTSKKSNQMDSQFSAFINRAISQSYYQLENRKFL